MGRVKVLVRDCETGINGIHGDDSDSGRKSHVASGVIVTATFNELANAETLIVRQ